MNRIISGFVAGIILIAALLLGLLYLGAEREPLPSLGVSPYPAQIGTP